MKLVDYLKAIRECPDELVKWMDDGIKIIQPRLTADFGIHGNFPVLINGNINLFFRKLREIGEIDPGCIEGVIHEFKDGSAVLQKKFSTGGYFRGEEKIKEFLKIKYQSQFYIHPSELFSDSVSPYRGMASAIEKVAGYLVKDNIPFCLPSSRGWKKREDYSQIVIFPDADEEEFIKLIKSAR